MNRPVPAVGKSMRIVVRGVNWLGDAVMTTPALRRLRERFPSAHITLLSPAKLGGLWMAHPDVDDVMNIERGEGLWSVSRRVRGRKFDIAVIFPNSPRSALECLLAGVSRRVGRRWPWRSWMLTDPIPAPAHAVPMRKRPVEEIRSRATSVLAVPDPDPDLRAHQMYHYLDLVAALGADSSPLAPLLAITGAEVEAVRQKHGFRPGSAWLGINAGAEYGPAKRWPAERFAAVADAVRREFDCGIAIFGGLGDLALAEELADQLRTAAPTLRILAGKTSLRELLAALRCCRVLLTNDTGPMHVAAALSVPVVVPFGSTSPILTGPGLPGDPRHRLIRSSAPCAPCFLRTCPIDLRCLRDITVDQVVSEVRRAWTSVQE